MSDSAGPLLMDFWEDGVAAIAAHVQSGNVSAREVTQHALARIEEANDRINAFCAVNADDALAQADAIDASGDKGPLAGIPIGVKDLEDARGFVTSYGSALHTDDPPAEADSPLVARLRAAGCVVIGKTNTPEFGFKGTTDNVAFGATANPWDLGRSPGGSSGGSGAAIAAGMVPLATGSDGGGSIRIPSALCGLSGIKCQQGRVPLGGHNPPGTGPLSVKGPMARRIDDVALALDACVGPHPTDAYSLPAPAEPWAPQLADVQMPERVAWSPAMGFAEVDAEVLSVTRSVVDALVSEGCEVIELDAVFGDDPVASWIVLWTVMRDRAQGHLRGTDDWHKVDPELRRQIEMGSDFSAVDFANAYNACHHLSLELDAAFDVAPLILTPTVCGQTPKLGQQGTINGVEEVGWVRFTYGINMTRNPAGSVCAGLTADGLPVGLQVIGRQLDDVGVLKAIAAIEELVGFSDRPTT